MLNIKCSVRDKVNAKMAPVIRKIKDSQIATKGTKTQVLRITTEELDALGTTDLYLNTQLIDNVNIEAPFSGLELGIEYNPETGEYKVKGINLFADLPVQLEVPFYGNPNFESNDLIEGDILVEKYYDHYNNIIPVVWQTTSSAKASFRGKHLVKRTYDISLYRGEFTEEINAIVNQYLYPSVY